jgi:hypothetical protein
VRELRREPFPFAPRASEPLGHARVAVESNQRLEVLRRDPLADETRCLETFAHNVDASLKP